LREARGSEAILERPAREELQKALQWAGFYNAAIDGSFGRGTRAAMQDWQFANNQEPTGVLTTKQRAMLFDQYNAVLESVSMRLVRDDASGIQMEIPTGVVAFDAYQPPFVMFEPSGDVPKAKVLLISQSGNAGRMAGLFEVLQTLDIVPTEGERRLLADGFVINGADANIQSYTSVSLRDGEIKGFTLVWPAGDDQRRDRILDVMKSSFERLPGTLDPQIVPASDDQAIDMVAGLAVRQPRLSRSGFYASTDGIVVTTPEAVQSCERITLDRQYEAEVIISDPELNIALLRPLEPLAPIGVAALQTATPRLQDRIAVAGYPFGGVLSAPTLTFGEIVDIRGLTGNPQVKRLAILPQPSDAGGPVFDESGAVLGMLLSRKDGNGQVLPEEVNFSVKSAEIAAFLSTQGVEPVISDVSAPITAVALTRRAANLAVLVSCW
jgi:S1-C subfamily serine protease